MEGHILFGGRTEVRDTNRDADVEGRGFDKFKATDLTFSMELEWDKSEKEKVEISKSH